MHAALARPELISLAAGFVDQQSLPVEAVGEAMQKLMADRSAALAALQYGTNAGYAPLRERLLDMFRAADGHPATEDDLTVDQFVLTAGSNQLLHLVCETILDPGDIVLCASPTYFVFLGALRNLGLRSVGVATDTEGVVPESLDETLRRYDEAGQLHRVKALYLTTYFDNPSSVTLALERRPQIVEIVRRWSKPARPIYIIEDTAYRELRYAGDDVPTLRSFDPSGETVIVAQTFSKSFSPGVRVGWGILPPALVGPLCDQKGNIDFGSPNLNQHLMFTVLEEGLYEPHVERLRQSYRTKLEAMLEAADAYLAPLPGVQWMRPEGGLYVWLRLPEEVDAGVDGALFQRAMDRGVLYVPGEYCYPSEGVEVAKNTIRLSFGVQPPERIREGVKHLADAVADVLDSATPSASLEAGAAKATKAG